MITTLNCLVIVLPCIAEFLVQKSGERLWLIACLLFVTEAVSIVRCMPSMLQAFENHLHLATINGLLCGIVIPVQLHSLHRLLDHSAHSADQKRIPSYESANYDMGLAPEYKFLPFLLLLYMLLPHPNSTAQQLTSEIVSDEATDHTASASDKCRYIYRQYQHVFHNAMLIFISFCGATFYQLDFYWILVITAVLLVVRQTHIRRNLSVFEESLFLTGMGHILKHVRGLDWSDRSIVPEALRDCQWSEGGTWTHCISSMVASPIPTNMTLSLNASEICVCWMGLFVLFAAFVECSCNVQPTAEIVIDATDEDVGCNVVTGTAATDQLGSKSTQQTTLCSGSKPVVLGDSRAALVVAAVLVPMLGVLAAMLGRYVNCNAALWVVRLLFAENYACLGLCGLWLLWIGCSIVTASVTDSYFQWAKSSSRKVFHVAAVAIFVPPLLGTRYYRPDVDFAPFLVLALSMCLCLFILLEIIRYFNLPAIGPVVNTYCRKFVETQKTLVLDHMYLLVGCAGSAWYFASESMLKSRASHNKLSFILGTLFVGIGDGAGALVGANYGRWKWRTNSGRTVEGSMAAFLFMAICILYVDWRAAQALVGNFASAAQMPEPPTVSTEAWSALLSGAVITLIEAHTSDNDNLMLCLCGLTVYGSVYLLMNL